MKKLALALVASTVAISAANASIGTGFYLGAALGYGATTGKYAVPGAGTGVPVITGSQDVGGNSPNIGVYGGYGWVNNCLYFGGEVAYTFDNSKISNSLNTTLFPSGPSQLKRNGYFTAALRGGYLFTPATMLYIRLGANWGKWTFNDANFFSGPFSPATPGGGSKSRMSFAPGLGLETALNKNVYLRLEYTYEFGPSVRAINTNLANTATSIGTIRSQSGKIGLAYKF